MFSSIKPKLDDNLFAVLGIFTNSTFFFLNDLFLYLAIDTVFHPSGIIQNGMEISSKSHV